MRLRPALFALSLALLSCRSAAAETPRIPLLQGTVYTLASSYPAGDEEHIATLSQLDDKLAVFAVESRAPVEGEAGKEQSARWERQVRRQDLVDGHRLNTVFQTGDPALFAGASFMHLSTAAFQELKDRGETALVLGTIKDFQGSGAKASMLMAVLSGRKYFRGTLKRVGSGTVDIPVLVNGERRLLPAIASVGELSVGADRIRVKYWWLDDAQDALMLRSDHRQLVRLDYPMPAPEKTLAASLSSGDCRATLPGIYFDTGSATLLAQSDTALQTVATLLKANPGWALTVEGHTDNVGAAAYNLDLSKRRAAAVQSALQSRHGIAAKQLSAQGYGITRPVQDNQTLEGRAANRRVELLRACPKN